MLRRLLLLLPLVCAPLVAQDTTVKGVRLGMAYGTGQRPGVAVLPVAGVLGDSIRAMLWRDLDFGDRVIMVGGRNADDLPPVDGTPNYAAFAQMNVAAIVQASVTPTGDLHVALYDVTEKRPLQAKSFPLAAKALSADWRMDVHRAADEVELWSTGVRGISATRIAFARGNQIWTIDSDGAFATPLAGTANGLSPAWDPTGRYLAFSTLPGSDAGAIMMADLATRSVRRITQSVRSGSFPSPMFSPDGAMLAYAFGVDGSDVFAVDPAKPGRPTRITVGRSGVINTMPSFSPDARKIAFTSSRLNHAEVYICDVDGSNVELLTQGGFGDQFYRSNPAWSPDNRAIAFQSQIDGVFQIMLISPNGNHVAPPCREDIPRSPTGRADRLRSYSGSRPFRRRARREKRRPDLCPRSLLHLRQLDRLRDFARGHLHEVGERIQSAINEPRNHCDGNQESEQTRQGGQTLRRVGLG